MLLSGSQNPLSLFFFFFFMVPGAGVQEPALPSAWVTVAADFPRARGILLGCHRGRAVAVASVSQQVYRCITGEEEGKHLDTHLPQTLLHYCPEQAPARGSKFMQCWCCPHVHLPAEIWGRKWQGWGYFRMAPGLLPPASEHCGREQGSDKLMNTLGFPAGLCKLLWRVLRKSVQGQRWP